MQFQFANTRRLRFTIAHHVTQKTRTYLGAPGLPDIFEVAGAIAPSSKGAALGCAAPLHPRGAPLPRETNPPPRTPGGGDPERGKGGRGKTGHEVQERASPRPPVAKTSWLPTARRGLVHIHRLGTDVL
eukprot:61834-Pyramimonas_sp.AAC.1